MAESHDAKVMTPRVSGPERKRGPRTWRPPVWLCYLLSGVLAVAVYLPLPSGAVQEVFFILIGLSAATAVIAGVAIHRPGRPLPWCFAALGLLIVVAGDTFVLAHLRALRLEYPSPSVTDALYVGAYAALIAGLLLMRDRRSSRKADLIDTMIVATGMGMLYWVFLLEPAANAHGLSALQRPIDAAYLLADALLLAALMRFLLAPFALGGRPSAFYFVAAALGLLLITDAANVALAGAYQPASLVDAGWLASYVLFGAAALHPSMAVLSEPGTGDATKLTWHRLVLLAGTALLVPGALALQAALGRSIEVPVIAGASVVLFVLVVARMAVMTSQREMLERRLAFQASYDYLAGLANRTLFTDRLRQALARAARRESEIAVLYLDLDNFKVINDSLGLEAGDELLVAVAGRLRECLRPEDTAARLGGDEFVVLLEDVAEAGDATRVAERVAEKLRASFALAGQEVFVTASIGIAYSDGTHRRLEDLLRGADLAMYRAKHAGKACHEVFEEAMNDLAHERLEMSNDLRRALEKGEFVVCYQPNVSLDTGEIVGFEALVRWEHPERGRISPAQFIPLTEETGMIIPIGRWVLRTACREAKRWHRLRGNAPPIVSVNLSARQFRDPGLVKEVAGVLRETGLEPGNLTLEITESVLMDDAPSTAGTLQELKALGVRLAIDDFGTGYSSLSYLQRFPVDYLKIDRSFTDDLEQSVDDTVLVSGVVSLAQSLDLEVVAEGVETEKQVACLRDMGCKLAQGFYFFVPVSGEAASRLLGARVLQ